MYLNVSYFLKKIQKFTNYMLSLGFELTQAYLNSPSNANHHPANSKQKATFRQRTHSHRESKKNNNVGQVSQAELEILLYYCILLLY